MTVTITTHGKQNLGWPDRGSTQGQALEDAITGTIEEISDQINVVCKEVTITEGNSETITHNLNLSLDQLRIVLFIGGVEIADSQTIFNFTYSAIDANSFSATAIGTGTTSAVFYISPKTTVNSNDLDPEIEIDTTSDIKTTADILGKDGVFTGNLTVQGTVTQGATSLEARNVTYEIPESVNQSAILSTTDVTPIIAPRASAATVTGDSIVVAANDGFEADQGFYYKQFYYNETLEGKVNTRAQAISSSNMKTSNYTGKDYRVACKGYAQVNGDLDEYDNNPRLMIYSHDDFSDSWALEDDALLCNGIIDGQTDINNYTSTAGNHNSLAGTCVVNDYVFIKSMVFQTNSLRLYKIPLDTGDLANQTATTINLPIGGSFQYVLNNGNRNVANGFYPISDACISNPVPHVTDPNKVIFGISCMLSTYRPSAGESPTDSTTCTKYITLYEVDLSATGTVTATSLISRDFGLTIDQIPDGTKFRIAKSGNDISCFTSTEGNSSGGADRGQIEWTKMVYDPTAATWSAETGSTQINNAIQSAATWWNYGPNFNIVEAIPLKGDSTKMFMAVSLNDGFEIRGRLSIFVILDLTSDVTTPNIAAIMRIESLGSGLGTDGNSIWRLDSSSFAVTSDRIIFAASNTGFNSGGGFSQEPPCDNYLTILDYDFNILHQYSADYLQTSMSYAGWTDGYQRKQGIICAADKSQIYGFVWQMSNFLNGDDTQQVGWQADAYRYNLSYRSKFISINDSQANYNAFKYNGNIVPAQAIVDNTSYYFEKDSTTVNTGDVCFLFFPANELSDSGAIQISTDSGIIDTIPTDFTGQDAMAYYFQDLANSLDGYTDVARNSIWFMSFDDMKMSGLVFRWGGGSGSALWSIDNSDLKMMVIEKSVAPISDELVTPADVGSGYKSSHMMVTRYRGDSNVADTYTKPTLLQVTTGYIGVSIQTVKDALDYIYTNIATTLGF